MNLPNGEQGCQDCLYSTVQNNAVMSILCINSRCCQSFFILLFFFPFREIAMLNVAFLDVSQRQRTCCQAKTRPMSTISWAFEVTGSAQEKKKKKKGLYSKQQNVNCRSITSNFQMLRCENRAQTKDFSKN